MSRVVSQKYKDIMAGIVLPATLYRITFGIETVGAVTDVTLTTENKETAYSDLQNIKDKYSPTEDYMTQEWNTFPLDRSKIVIEDMSKLQKNMFAPDILSNSNAEYIDNKPAFEAQFTKLIDLIGLTFVFDNLSGTYPSSLTIKAYNGEALVKEVEGNPTSYEYPLELDLVNIDKFTVEVNSSNLPYARTRITRIYFGLIDVHTEVNTTEISQSYSLSPINNELFKSTINYKMDNFDNLYDIDNPQGIYKFITEQQPIKIEYSIDGEEWIEAGNYLSSGRAKIEDNLTSIEGIDQIQYMNDTYNKDVYRTTEISLYDLALDVLSDFGWTLNEVGEYPYMLDDGLKDIMTVGTLPVAKHSECLQIIAFAAGMGLYVDDKGYICIKPLPTEVADNDYYINFSYMGKEPTPEQIEPLAQVDMTVHNYTVESEIKELNKAEYTITESETIKIEYDLSTEQTASIGSDAEITASRFYGRYCELDVTGTGTFEVIVKGKKVEDNTSVYTKVYSTRGEIAPYDNPLITNNTIAENVATHIGDYLSCRTRYTLDWLEDYRVNIGDLVKIKSQYTDNLIGRVIKLKTSEPKLMGEMEVVIIEP